MSAFDCILGQPWLEKVEPVVRWRAQKMLVAHHKMVQAVDVSVDPCVTTTRGTSLLSVTSFKKLSKKGEAIYAVAMTTAAQEPAKTTTKLEPK
jgi:hypothetical protein